MIPATGYVARKKVTARDGVTYITSEPVVAWSDDGDALVVDHGSGCLRPANQSKGFAGLNSDEGSVVAVLPGGGWLMHFTDEDGSWTEPVVGWTVTANGVVEALSTDLAGDVEGIGTVGNKPTFSHPDRTKVSPVAPSQDEAGQR